MAGEVFVNEVKCWGDYSFSFAGGRINKGFTSFKFKASFAKANKYAEGNEPIGRGYGNKDYSGEMGVHVKAYLRLREIAVAAGYSTLDYLPFFGTLSWAEIEDDSGFPKKVFVPTNKHTFENAEFTDLDFAVSQGDYEVIIPLPFIAGKITGI